MKLVVVIPAFNEEKTIGKVIDKIPKSIDGIDKVQILVVDDGSVDKTSFIAKQKGCTVVSHTRNKGLGKAFNTGIENALKLGADIIVNIDADDQFDPSEIPKLIKPILENDADMVSGSRFKNKESISEIPFIRRWGNRAFTWFVNRLTGQEFTDTQCGFRAYSKEAALRLNLFGKFTYTQEVFLDLVNKEMRIKEVPIKVKYFDGRKSNISGSLIKYVFQALLIMFRTFRDYKPLVFFGIPGFLSFFIGFLVFLLIDKLIGSALVILGFLLVDLALIADMQKPIRKIQEEILYRLRRWEYEKQNNSHI